MKKIIILFVLTLLISCKKDKNLLLDMNNVQMPLFDEIKHKASSNDTLKILIIGNSITSHGIANEIGWKHKSGMAASTENNDYVHLLLNQLSLAYPNKNITIRFSNYSELERSPEKFAGKDWNKLINFKPNKLIFQLSDNITKESYIDFKKSSLELLNSFTNTDIYVISPFFMSVENYNVSKDIALKAKATFIDITDLSNSTENKAINEKNYPADKNSWTVDGIGQHPGNKGMLNLSNEIFKTIYPKN